MMKRQEKDGYLNVNVNKLRLTNLAEPNEPNSAVTRSYSDAQHNEQSARLQQLETDVKKLAKEITDRVDNIMSAISGSAK
jgi:hypothetical protein